MIIITIEIGEEDVNRATGTLDTNTFEVNLRDIHHNIERLLSHFSLIVVFQQVKMTGNQNEVLSIGRALYLQVNLIITVEILPIYFVDKVETSSQAALLNNNCQPNLTKSFSASAEVSLLFEIEILGDH